MPRSACALILCLVLLAGPVPGRVAAAPEGEPATVLVIHSYSSITPYTARQMDGIRAVIVDRLGPRTQFIEESLNILRPISDDQQRLIRDLLRLRYAGSPIDLVMTTDTPALEFMASHGREVFPDKPIVFCAAHTVPDRVRAPGSGITGVTERTDPRGTLELIRSLHPEVRRVLTIGTPGLHSRRLEQSAIDAAASFDPPFEINPLRDDDEADLHAMVGRLGREEAILYLSLYTIHGRVNRVDDCLPVLSAAASRPMYALFDVYIGHGPVGGRVADGRSYGEQAGEIAARILAGTPASAIPIIEGSTRPVFDARQLSRWGIDPQALPDGSEVLFEGESFWKSNRSALLTSSAVALVLLPALGAFAFLWIRASRSARVLRDTRDHQSDIAESLGVGLVVQDDTGRITEANPQAERILGLTRDQLLGRGSLDPRWSTVNADGSPLVGDEQPSMIALRTGEAQRDRLIGVHRPDGSLAWLSVNAVPLAGADGPTPRFTVTTFSDITPERTAVEWQTGVNDVLRRLALDEPIGEVLKALCAAVERRAQGMPCSILLLDAEGRRLRHGAAPSLPADLWEPVDGLEIGPSVGSCGTAAFRRQRVIVENIAASPLWEGHAEPLLRHGIRACWSEPMRDPDGAVLGTLALYSITPRPPTESEVRLMESAATIAGVVISKHRKEQQIRESDERFRSLTDNIPGAVYRSIMHRDGSRTLLFASREYESVMGRPPVLGHEPYSARDARYHPEDIPRMRDEFREAGARLRAVDVDARVVHPSGEARWVKIRSSPTPLPDGDVLWDGVILDIHSQKCAQDEVQRLAHTRAMLLEELDHRVKNSLAGLLTLIDLSASSGASADLFAEAIRARVHAMSAAHSLLSRSQWQPIALQDLIEALLPAGLRHRVRAGGHPLLVPARHATAVGMVVQELLTNALKHGALSNQQGAVDLSWTVEPATDERLTVTMEWRESDGPPIAVTPTPGVGSSLVEGLLGFQLGGVAQLRFPREGARHTLRFSVESHAVRVEPPARAHANGAARTAAPTAT